MDQELVAYLDERFRETSQQIQDLREEMTQRFEVAGEETSQQIQDLRKEMTQRFEVAGEETSQQIQDLREESNGRFEKLEAGIRQTQVMVEGVRSDLQLVAEGVIGSNEKIEALRGELVKGLDELRSTIRHLPYTDLQNRVRALESWRETRERDPIDIIREKFGRPKKED